MGIRGITPSLCKMIDMIEITPMRLLGTSWGVIRKGKPYSSRLFSLYLKTRSESLKKPLNPRPKPLPLQPDPPFPLPT